MYSNRRLNMNESAASSIVVGILGAGALGSLGMIFLIAELIWMAV